MRRFMRLFHNEWTKLFSRPLVYIMIGIILLVTFLFGLIVKQSTVHSWEISYDEYKEDWDRHMRSYIAQLQTQKNSAQGEQRKIIEGGDGRTIYVEEGMSTVDDGTSQVYFDAMIEYAEYCLEKGIDGGNWRLLAMNEMAVLRAEIAAVPQGGDTAAAQAKLDKFQGFVESGDWRGYEKYSFENGDFGGDKAAEKAAAERLRLRLAYNIEPFNSPPSMSVRAPWQEEALMNHTSAVIRVETGEDGDGKKLTAAGLKHYKNELKVQEYRLKHGIPLVQQGTFSAFVGQSGSLMMVVSLCVIILAATQVASEYTSGTVKLLLIAPYKRWKILLSKIALMIAVSIIMYGVLMLSSVIVGLILFGAGGIHPYVTVIGGKAVGLPFMLLVAIKYLLAYPELLVFTSLAVMLAVVMRHSAVAIGTGVALLFGGEFINQLLWMIRYDFTRFILHANTNLGQYFPGLYQGNIFDTRPPLHNDMTLGFSLAVLAVYLICINYIAFDSFNRRDIK